MYKLSNIPEEGWHDISATNIILLNYIFNLPMLKWVERVGEIAALW